MYRQRWKNLGVQQIITPRRNVLADIFDHLADNFDPLADRTGLNVQDWTKCTGLDLMYRTGLNVKDWTTG